MNWYVVYRGKRPGVYNSWRSCHEQVTGFSNNNYQGFETLQEAKENYSNFLKGNEVIEHEMIAQVMANEMAAELGNQVVGSRIKDFIIIVLVLVIVKLMLV